MCVWDWKFRFTATRYVPFSVCKWFFCSLLRSLPPPTDWNNRKIKQALFLLQDLFTLRFTCSSTAFFSLVFCFFLYNNRSFLFTFALHLYLLLLFTQRAGATAAPAFVHKTVFILRLCFSGASLSNEPIVPLFVANGKKVLPSGPLLVLHCIFSLSLSISLSLSLFYYTFSPFCVSHLRASDLMFP